MSTQFGNGYSGMSATGIMMYQRQQQDQAQRTASESAARTSRTTTCGPVNATSVPFAPNQIDCIPPPPPTPRTNMPSLYMQPEYQPGISSAANNPSAAAMRIHSGMMQQHDHQQQINGTSVYHDSSYLPWGKLPGSSPYTSIRSGLNEHNIVSGADRMGSVSSIGVRNPPLPNEAYNFNQNVFPSSSDSDEYVRLPKDHPLAMLYTQMQQQQQDRERQQQQLAILQQQYQQQQLAQFQQQRHYQQQQQPYGASNHPIGDPQQQQQQQIQRLIAQAGGYNFPGSSMMQQQQQQHMNIQAIQQQHHQSNLQEQHNKQKMMSYATGAKALPTRDNDALTCVEALLQFRENDKDGSSEDHESEDDHDDEEEHDDKKHRKNGGKGKRYGSYACQVWNELPNSNHRLPEEIVDPSDHDYGATAFSYEVMAAMIPCTFKRNDSRGKRINLPVGFPGLCCRYCLGGKETEQSVTKTGRFFPASIKTMADTAKSLMAIYRHLLKCDDCPLIVKQRMERFKGTHESERRRRAYGSQKQFYTRIWFRLHGRLPPGGSKTIDKKFPLLEDGDPALLRHDKFSQLKCMSEVVYSSPSKSKTSDETNEDADTLINDSTANYQSNEANDSHAPDLQLNRTVDNHVSSGVAGESENGIINSENISDGSDSVKQATSV